MNLLQRRKQYQEKTLANAIGLLIENDVAREDRVGIEESELALVNLVKAVGAYLGLEEANFVSPAKLDRADRSFETLKNIFILQDIRLRKVNLEPGWHKKDN